MSWLGSLCLGIFLVLLGTQAFATSGPAASTVTAPFPPATGCTSELPNDRLGGPSAVNVQIDPQTVWRPPGTQVRFIIASTTGTAPAVTRVYACFRWAAQNQKYATGFTPSPLVSAIPTSDGTIEYGAILQLLPGMHPVGGTQWTSLHTVPLAEMQIIVGLQDGSWVTAILPVGVTNPLAAIALPAIAFILAVIILWRLVPKKFLGKDDGEIEKMRVGQKISRHILALIANNQGVASLAQLQIMIWTFVVAIAAIYVMTLSGNLIPISDGTLALLGIASGSALVVRFSPSDENVPANMMPEWIHLFKKNISDTEIDVTRVQMLIFTLITATFVVLKVIGTFGIPDIPINMQILMGISNGVYLVGRQAPDQKAAGS